MLGRGKIIKGLIVVLFCAIVTSFIYGIPSIYKGELIGKKSETRVNAKFRNRKLRERVRRKQKIKSSDFKKFMLEIKDHKKKCEKLKLRPGRGEIINNLNTLVEGDKCE